MLAQTSMITAALLAGQIAFDRAVQDLSSPNTNTRLHAAQLLKETASPEAALPLAKAVTDASDEVQLEAIAGELNIFLADRIVPRRRVGLIVEVRTAIVAEAAFGSGPLAIGPRPVPAGVLTALRAGARDDNPLIALESLYAFGALSTVPSGPERREVMRLSGLDLAAMIGYPEPSMRIAALRVIGRLFGRRPEDAAADPSLIQAVGDAVIKALNDRDRAVRSAAMDALGSMRYERGVQALADLVRFYGRGELAEAATDAIARIGHPSSAPLLLSQLTSRSPAMKLVAIEGLARIGDEGNRPAIGMAVRGERNEAVLLAVSFANATLAGAPPDPIVDALRKPRRRDQALQYLVELSATRRAALEPSLRDSDPGIRVGIVEAFGLALDPAARSIVEPLASDPNPQVAKAAEWAAARLR
jgi:HEAT repeat protein